MEDFFQFEHRRDALLNIMNSLKERSINCFSCRGVCCTFEANSMMVTPLEALELYFFLQNESRWDDTLVSHIKSTITRYRLDVELQTHKEQIMRKTYTCPFYAEGPKGCSIPRKMKPYGCLGFNPLRSGCTGEGGCSVYEKELIEREYDWELREEKANKLITETLQLCWKKIDICRGLMSMDERKDLLNNKFLKDVAHLLEL